MKVVLAPLLIPLSFIYGGVSSLRAWLYSLGVIPSDSSGSFVVSIGNIQAGGTGKTPIVDFFARRWKDRVRLGIVSRGYRRSSRGSLRVDFTKPNAAHEYGDEPTWLAQVTGVPVQVGERKLKAAQDLTASEGLKMILLDDGFQHFAIRRSHDIVLVDVSAPDWHWRILPWGRLRESVSALRRADTVILTKTESVSGDRCALLERKIETWAGRSLPFIRFRQNISWSAQAGSIFLVAGLARPEVFFEMVASHPSHPNVVGQAPFADHHSYSASDVLRIKERARVAGATCVMVTEKDAVKLIPLWGAEDKMTLVVAKLEVAPARESDVKQLEHLDEVILGQVIGKTGRSHGARTGLSDHPSSR